MNKVILIGRLTKDTELKTTANQIQFVSFTLAVDRKYKDSNGQRQADFISCTAWRQTAAFINQYFSKGSKIAVVGSINTRSYQDDSGNKHFVTEVTVEEADFVESRQPTMAEQAPTKPTSEVVPPSEYPIEVTEEAELPFEV